MHSGPGIFKAGWFVYLAYCGNYNINIICFACEKSNWAQLNNELCGQVTASRQGECGTGGGAVLSRQRIWRSYRY